MWCLHVFVRVSVLHVHVHIHVQHKLPSVLNIDLYVYMHKHVQTATMTGAYPSQCILLELVQQTTYQGHRKLKQLLLSHSTQTRP